MGKAVSADLREKKACWCCSDHGMGARLTRLDAKALLRRLSVRGVTKAGTGRSK